MSEEYFSRGTSALDDGARRAAVLHHVGAFGDVLDLHCADAAVAVAGGIQGVRALACSMSRPSSRSLLVDRITDERTLRMAWEHLALNGGAAPGPDKKRYSDYTSNEVWQYCRTLRDALRQGSYRPGEEMILHVEKESGKGHRPIVLMNIQDRVVQRAVVSILQPLLNPFFDPRTFGYRPKLGHLHALACAEWLTLSEKRSIWVTHDIKDAFLHVPVPRLLQVARTFFPVDDLIELLGLLLPGKLLPGLRQGGPLSPLMMNLYLHHFLDRPWRREHPDLPLIRVADDLLILCKTMQRTEGADAALRKLLLPTGMFLKETDQNPIRDLNDGDSATWMGFSISRTKGGLACEINQRSWNRLNTHLALAHTKSDSPLRAIRTIKQWLNQRGPCYRWSDREDVCEEIIAAARKQAFEEVPTAFDLQQHWLRANSRWGRFRKEVRVDQQSSVLDIVSR